VKQSIGCLYLTWRRIGSLRMNTVRPNPSLSPRPTTAGVVSPVRASSSIIANRAYNTCLRGRG